MKKILNGLLSLSLSLAFAAQAITIDLIPDQTQLNLSDTLEVSVHISGLDHSNAPSLGVYDLDFSYDANLFSIKSIEWGDPLLGNQLDLMGFGSIQESSAGTGWLNIFELSFDDPLTLNLLQAGEFILFSILLDTISTGSGNFALSVNASGSAWGEELLIDQINGAQVTIGSISVPEPSGFLLLLSMLAITGLRLKITRQRQ